MNEEMTTLDDLKNNPRREAERKKLVEALERFVRNNAGVLKELATAQKDGPKGKGGSQ